MDSNPLVAMLSIFVEGKPVVSKSAKLPPDAKAAFEKWASQNNLPLDEPDTETDFYTLSFPSSNVPTAYYVDVAGDDPDPFRATAVIQSGKIIGEWGMVGD